MQLAKRVWDFATSRDLLHDRDTLVVGVSGGPDSLCLLDVLHTLAPRHALKLHVAHLNHGLRPEAGAEADFARAEAERRGLSFFSEAVDVAAAAQAAHESIETTARAQRYNFFRRVARQAGASAVAVAHTADDQAETVLMHLLRGAGLRGLRGMLPKRSMGDNVTGNRETDNTQDPSASTHPPSGLSLIRPLLFVTRAEVLAYCAERSLAPRLDRSNADPRYRRNRVRLELLPLLETYNPNIRAGLARAAEAAAGDYALWLDAAHQLWTATLAADPPEPGQVAFDRACWLALDVPQQLALLRLAAEQLAPGPAEVDFAPLEAAVQFSRRAPAGRSCALAGGLRLIIGVNRVTLSAPLAREPAGGPQVVDGRLVAGWRLVIEPLEAGKWTLAEVSAAPRLTAYVDSDRLTGPLHLRARQRGDRFQPLGLGGRHKLLSEFFVDQKLPAPQRGTWPLLTSGDELVWVVGLRLDERYKVTTDTACVTRLSLVIASGS